MSTRVTLNLEIIRVADGLHDALHRPQLESLNLAVRGERFECFGQLQIVAVQQVAAEPFCALHGVGDRPDLNSLPRQHRGN